MDERANRPTLWIVIAGMCALAAIGLLIWGLSTKSDLDDANAQLAQEQSTLSDEERAAAASEAKERAFGERTQQRYQQLRDRFLSAQKRAETLKSDVERESAEVAQARADASEAQGQDARLQAQLREAREQLQLAGTCARGAITALDHFFDAADVQTGADRAIKHLEDLQDQCQEAAGETA